MERLRETRRQWNLDETVGWATGRLRAFGFFELVAATMSSIADSYRVILIVECLP